MGVSSTLVGDGAWPACFIPVAAVPLPAAAPVSGERRLYAAIIYRALLDLEAPETSAANRRMYLDAREWFIDLARRDEHSFSTVADHLGLDAGAVAAYIKKHYPEEGKRWQETTGRFTSVALHHTRQTSISAGR